MRIETIEEQLLVGKSIDMSLSNNKNEEIWSSFMPLKKTIPNLVSNDLYSVQIYPKGFTGQPNEYFTKWAAAPVLDHENIPNGLDKLTIPAGLYAVFIHKGFGKDYSSTVNEIYYNWLPSSEYELDQRPQFELMGQKYLGYLNESSEEEIWIPIKKK